MEWSVSEELLAQAIGRETLQYAKREDLMDGVEGEAVKLLEEIRAVLNDESLDDPECFQKIEAIVAAFHRHGVSTWRHDYG